MTDRRSPPNGYRRFRHIGVPASARMAIEAGEASVVVSYCAINLPRVDPAAPTPSTPVTRPRRPSRCQWASTGRCTSPPPPPATATATASRPSNWVPWRSPPRPRAADRTPFGATAHDGRLPRQPDGRRPVARARLLPRQRRRRRVRHDESQRRPRPAPSSRRRGGRRVRLQATATVGLLQPERRPVTTPPPFPDPGRTGRRASVRPTSTSLISLLHDLRSPPAGGPRPGGERAGAGCCQRCDRPGRRDAVSTHGACCDLPRRRQPVVEAVRQLRRRGLTVARTEVALVWAGKRRSTTLILTADR